MTDISALHFLGLIITGTYIGGFLLFGVIYFVAQYDRDNSNVRHAWHAIAYKAAAGVIVAVSLLSLDL